MSNIQSLSSGFCPLSSGTVILQILGLLSLLSFVVSLVCIPWLINRLPDDFFTLKSHWQRTRRRRERHPLIMIMVVIVRNCIGFVFMAAGMVMIFIPGQGILTILLGLVLMDFPGKHRLIVLIIQHKRVWRALNWIRAKGRRQPFIFDDKSCG